MIDPSSIHQGQLTMRLMQRLLSGVLMAVLLAWVEAADPGQTGVTKPEVSEKACPVKVISAATQDGHQATAVVRKPPGKGPFPAIVFLHGGLNQLDVQSLTRASLRQPTSPRFLAAGYVTVHATFRSRKEDPQTRAALVDCLAIIEQVKQMPEVDPKSIVLFGGSGGGSLALELAGETELAAIAAGEPATVLFAGLLTKENQNLPQIMADPRRFYTPDLQKYTQAKIRRINCPVLIVQGDVHPINKINNEIIIPELKAAGKRLEVILYPGQPHGFYFGGNGAPEAGQKCFDDSHAFFKRHLATQPRPLEESLVKRVPVDRK